MTRRSPRPSFWKPCQTCGGSFKTTPSAIERGFGNYCSIPCRPFKGAGNPRWRGGEISDGRGRVMVYAPGHPNASLAGGTHIYRYRLIASQRLGRPLAENEVVHHVNGDPSDDRPENLEVLTPSEHTRRHLPEMHAGWVRSKATCPGGHSLTDPANVRVRPHGWRACRACEMERSERRRLQAVVAIRGQR